ncbi:deubiquitinase OTUD6B-like [Liolophura sinensis]|uniref:deubiquitinase OTUD6B-like n=1 Tax=Liolophura sinensis TaxID=3198878 RepID=UPI0031593B4D
MAEHVDADSGVIECLDDLLQRHKKEKKALQAQIQKLKHGVSKGDKKKKKEVTEQIAKLEIELDQKQKQEVTEFKVSSECKEEDGVSGVADQLQSLQTGTEDVTGEENPAEPIPKKTSKAKKRREKRAEKDRNREERIREQEVINLQGDRHLEAQALKQKLSALGLAAHQIHSDGNCLYNALGHQLELRGIQEDNASLRQKTAEYMKTHPDDYLPFLSNENTGDMFTSDEFDEYCKNVATTSAWGGQLELRALSDVLRVPIKVLQATGPDLILGEQHKTEPLVLLYYRHAFGLGEHYNSVRPRQPEDEEEEVS